MEDLIQSVSFLDSFGICLYLKKLQVGWIPLVSSPDVHTHWAWQFGNETRIPVGNHTVHETNGPSLKANLVFAKCEGLP